ncbi:uncharacterized protein LOC109823329 [Asparagus officinalis]|uniref:uncharacterized protein LOC109823329 n=1 Tax=Asparagus officinalis TaxID=4686 RepID=UPI00098E26A4|nr:uncharacterized protein LOC109823329 [Asparagus officinalis]
MTDTTVDSPTSSRVQVADPIVIESDPKPTSGEIRTPIIESDPKPTSGEIRTPIFSGENYDFWRIKMWMIFIAHDLWKLMEKGFEVPEDKESLTPAEQKTLKINYMRDAKALGLIQNVVSNSIFPMISNEEIATVTWDILQEEHRGSEKVQAVKLQTIRKEFEQISMRVEERLDDFLTRFTNVINQLKTYGEDVTKQRVVKIILISLSSRYDPIVSVIEETKDMEKLSLQEAIASIKAFDQNLEKRNEASTMERALKSFNMSSNQQKTCGKSHQGKCWFEGKPKCTNCSRFGSAGSRGSPSAPTAPDLGIPKSSAGLKDCSRFGHTKEQCRTQGNQNQNCRQVFVNQEEDGEGNVFFACHGGKDSDVSLWYIGCSNHMTAKRSLLIDFDTSYLGSVKMGNENIVKSEGKGILAVNTKKGKRYIKDVMLVPGLEENLLSVGQMLLNGYFLVFGDQAVKIYYDRSFNNLVAKVKM